MSQTNEIHTFSQTVFQTPTPVIINKGLEAHFAAPLVKGVPP